MNNVKLYHAELDELLQGETGPVAKEILKRSIKIEAHAKRLVPVVTERLRSSIVHSVGKDAKGLYGKVSSDVAYAARIEYGFNRADSLGRNYQQSAQPYFRPALMIVMGQAGVGDVFTSEHLEVREGFSARRAVRVEKRKAAAKRQRSIVGRLPAAQRRLAKRGIGVTF